MMYLGDFAEDDIVHFQFTTSDGSGGAVAPSSAFEAADLAIFKDNSDTEKTAVDGITMTSPFNATTGLHSVSIDTGNNDNDAGFWVAGSDYSVVLAPDETVDGETVVKVLAQFSIERAGGVLAVLKAGTVQVDVITINSIATQLQMLMDASTTISADDDLTGVVVDKSVLSHIMTPAANTDTYDASTDSLQALGADVDTLITGVAVSSIGADVITPASVDEDADFTIQALSITNKLDAGSVEVDGAVAVGTTTTLSGNVSCGGTFDVVGALTANSVSIDAGFDVVGALTAGSLGIDANAVITGTTTFTGAVAMSAGLTAAITGGISGDVGGDVKGAVDGTVAGKTPAEAGDAMTLAADSIKKVTFDESTAYPLLSADTGASQVARVGADSDTLETLSDEIAALNDISVANITAAEVDNDGTAISVAGAFKLILSALTGISSGGGSNTIVFRDIADSKNRISATVDATGNRDAVGTRDAS